AALAAALRRGADDGTSFRRYRVHVLVDHGVTAGAPVVFEDHPTFPALIGQVGHRAEFGALVSDFTLVQPGALHRANGGYLLLDALRVLQQPLAWDALKRTLRAGEIRIESFSRQLGLAGTVSLEPEPIPIERLKVVLVGERYLYYLLAEVDPDMLELFKVIADFEESVEWKPEVQARYARLLATIARKERLRPLDRGAVAALLEEASRLAEDSERLSVRMRPVADLVREADFRAGRAGRRLTTRDDVEAAVEAQRRRGGRVRERVLERIRRGTMLIETRGEAVGQVNGLVVMMLGEVAFGHPTRISARVRVGKGELVDIEREVELGGPIHSKGVLILSGYLGQRYAPRLPLALSASLVFEQSYGPVEGDSASLGELCALLSALAEAPVRQSLAITGSVSQSGRVQPIGGVNEKIEGFFDACREQGFEDGQGVLVPARNVQHLMLRRDVVEAVEAGRFRVVSVDSVDDAIEALTGIPAGERGADGAFPPGTVNRRVEDRLTALAEDAKAFGEKAEGE
ncbi:MAG TPA: Lon protease family protein, partial [Thermoanaerobaculia bacterium]|nr:Lon protease family protein [Thermoanaerobaculia bacterium]